MRIAVDEARVYWLSKSRSFSYVRSCEKNNCARTIVTYDVSNADLSGGHALAFQELAVHGHHIYWTRYTSGTGHSILSCPSAGCKRTGENDRHQRLSLDDGGRRNTRLLDDVSRGRDGHAPLADRRGASQALALNEVRPDRILVDATHLYWIGHWGLPNAEVRRVVKQGGEPPVSLVMGQNQAAMLALDSDFFHWANSYSVGTISRCPLSGCAGAAPMLIADQAHAGTLVTDGKSIFWTNITGASTGDQGRAAVLRCPVETCASATQTLAVQTFASDGLSMAIDQSDVYWVAQGDRDPKGSFPHATIYRHAK